VWVSVAHAPFGAFYLRAGLGGVVGLSLSWSGA
jgi:hypothetical protein